MISNKVKQEIKNATADMVKHNVSLSDLYINFAEEVGELAGAINIKKGVINKLYKRNRADVEEPIMEAVDCMISLLCLLETVAEGDFDINTAMMFKISKWKENIKKGIAIKELDEFVYQI